MKWKPWWKFKKSNLKIHFKNRKWRENVSPNRLWINFQWICKCLSQQNIFSIHFIAKFLFRQTHWLQDFDTHWKAQPPEYKKVILKNILSFQILFTHWNIAVFPKIKVFKLLPFVKYSQFDISNRLIVSTKKTSLGNQVFSL